MSQNVPFPRLRPRDLVEMTKVLFRSNGGISLAGLSAFYVMQRDLQKLLAKMEEWKSWRRRLATSLLVAGIAIVKRPIQIVGGIVKRPNDNFLNRRFYNVNFCLIRDAMSL